MIIYLISLLLPLLSPINTQKEIIPLTDHNFDNEISKSKSSKWLVIFYVDNCPYCHQSINIIKNEVLENYQNKDVLFGSVDCNRNIWTASRFNITQIPHLVLLYKEKMYSFTSYSSKETIMKFIDDEKYVEEANPIPKAQSGFEKFMKAIGVLLESIDRKVEGFLNKHNIPIKWNRGYSYVVISIVFYVWVKVEMLLLGLCFKRGKKKEIKNENKEEEKLKEGNLKKEEEKEKKKEEKEKKE